ncbi:MAG: glycine/betaine ABC transporter ATP-binding protein [Firmicutes bacterium HGW-Firmicutes-2]|jgi:osmoprotectant transport system ATP-binding protein|nr:MAG: glycine/betaine ABC transporter ATP-binding protein [Firmicutes bacterium HGW-Firmicutes-2]
MGFIEFENITKSYDTSEIVIDHLSLTIPEGEFVTILGPSGCGKTTLLKMVNKLTPYSSGSITVDHKDIQDWDTIKLRRSIGYVIQQIGLLPHLSIEKNINYILNITKSDKKFRRGKAEELLELVGLSKDYLTRYPRELSGGQKQRVGVARALAADPKIILMDEPFGAVDEIARTALQDEILNIHKKLKKTILFVTHDIQEAIKLGTTIVLMNDGKIEQVGTKEDLIFSPANDFVREFFGIKGFQATLDKSILRDLYKRILTKEESIETLYQKLKS